MNKLKKLKLAIVGLAVSCLPMSGWSDTQQLRYIKANQNVVVSESDPTFQTWLSGTEFNFPLLGQDGMFNINLDVDKIYVGRGQNRKNLSQLLAAAGGGIANETDPRFNSWLGGTEFNFNGNGTASGTFKINPEGGAAGFWIGDKTLIELLQPKLEGESDPEFV